MVSNCSTIVPQDVSEESQFKGVEVMSTTTVQGLEIELQVQKSSHERGIAFSFHEAIVNVANVYQC
jgi:hypothetical protein